MNSRLKKIFIDIFNLSETIDVSDININNIVTWDSLNHLNLIMTIENEFEIQIPPDDFPELYEDFEKIILYVQNYLE